MNIENFSEEYARGGGRAGGSVGRGGGFSGRSSGGRNSSPSVRPASIKPSPQVKPSPTTKPYHHKNDKYDKHKDNDGGTYYYNYPWYPYYYPYYYPSNNFPYDYPYYYPYYNYPRYDYDTPNYTEIIVNPIKDEEKKEIIKEEPKIQKNEDINKINENKTQENKSSGNGISTELIIIISILLIFLIIFIIALFKK